jgi:hypothetical protein
LRSGTFLFHAVRCYLDAAEKAGMGNGEAIQGVTEHVIGLDVHPVAAALARVTYLLAIGRNGLAARDRGEITIPVYLGDTLQWEQNRDLFGGVDTVTISTAGDDLAGGGGTQFKDDLKFPRSILKNANKFDRLVGDLADKALAVEPADAGGRIKPVLHKFGIAYDSADAEILRETFSTMCALRAKGRNHIWGYYVRNLIRPLWLAEPENRVDVVLGNPPWLRYSKMTDAMQKRYKNLAKPRNLLTGGLGASGRDLSTLFVVRAVELYLREGGAFAFVMPHGALTRKPHTGFRSGTWAVGTGDELNVKFGTSWDLAGANTGFPMTSSVIHGRRSVEPGKMSAKTERWQGKFAYSDIPWAQAGKKITRSPGSIGVLDHGAAEPESPYKQRFRQGAILAPRMTLFVTDAQAGPLGAGAGRRAVTSHRVNQEKAPWKQCASLSANVEAAFVRPVYLGETVLPFRTATPREAVLPIAIDTILDPGSIALHAGLEHWWDDAERLWESHKVDSDESSLLERIDFHGQLSAQLPAKPCRVVYTASGNTLAAAIIRDTNAIVEHKLYWCAATSETEAHYLCAILNSDPLLAGVGPLQAVGLFGRRDFDKNVFAVPFPTFDPNNTLHTQLASLGKAAEKRAAEVDLDDAKTFQAARKRVAAQLDAAGISAKIVGAVTELLLVDA